MGTAVVSIILVAVIVLAVWQTARRIRHGSACCGEHDAAEKKVRVADRNKAHYPNVYVLAVDGMHCANCVRRVENAYNLLDGVWATASLEKKQLLVRAKQPMEQATLEKTAADAGYTVTSVKAEC